MIITDYNKMTLEELMVIHKTFDLEYTIEDGKITKAEREV